MSHRSSYASAAERSIASRSSVMGRPVFSCDQALAQTFMHDAALSSAGTTGCALHGASLFLVWPRKSNQKEGHPCIRVLLRKTSLAPALLRGSSRRAIPGPSLLARHPCLATPYATPTLGLLKGTRERAVWKFLNGNSNKALQSSAGFVGWKTAEHFPPQSTRRLVSNLVQETLWVSFALPTLRSPETRTTASLHGPSDTTGSPLSGGRMESLRRGASGMDAARAVKGHGWPLRGDPRSSDGMREVERSEPGTPSPMQGQDLLVPFGGAAIRATAKRDSPSRAKPSRRPTAPMGPDESSSNPSPTASRPRPLPQTAQPTLPFAARPSGVPAATSQVLPC